MPELRWTLLILGALFVGALALWELRRQRLARGQGVAQGANQGRDGERLSPTMDGGSEHGHEPGFDPPRGDTRMYREPTLSLPEMHLDARGGIHVSEAQFGRVDARGDHRADRSDSRDLDPMADLRVVDMDDASFAGESHSLRVDDEAAVDEFSTSRPEPEEFERVEPMIPELGPVDASELDRPTPAMARTVDSDVEAGAGLAASGGTVEGAETSTSGTTSVTDSSVAADSAATSEGAPIVDWPVEEVRKIIAFRLVSGAGERFSGRAVRLALAAEGFQLGKFDIFHKPGPDTRAVLSAASLTKPGTFQMATMDAQRFGGLSLFAVLPGPLSPTATFDELLITARALNDRLRGALQDERGEPLTPVRSATLRDSLTASATADAPVIGPASSPGAEGPAGVSPA